MYPEVEVSHQHNVNHESRYSYHRAYSLCYLRVLDVLAELLIRNRMQLLSEFSNQNGGTDVAKHCGVSEVMELIFQPML
jgi:hypothetical protein